MRDTAPCRLDETFPPFPGSHQLIRPSSLACCKSLGVPDHCESLATEALPQPAAATLVKPLT